VEKVYPSSIPSPEPDVKILQRIKNEKKEKLKQAARKDKEDGAGATNGQQDLGTVTAMESDLGTVTVMESL
jgi:hypothetical protein